MQSLLEALRHRTEQSHRDLERALQLESHLESASAYSCLLERFLGIYLPLEEKIGHYPQLVEYGYRMNERRKTPTLMRDLASLGISSQKIESLPQCPIEELRSTGAALGCAYVLEGSTLGGQVITRMIQANARGLPTGFFNVYGSRTRDRWLEFTGTLRAYETARHEFTDVEEGANSTFESFAQWLT